MWSGGRGQLGDPEDWYLSRPHERKAIKHGLSEKQVSSATLIFQRMGRSGCIEAKDFIRIHGDAAAHIFSMLDQNHDGSINLEEWLAFFVSVTELSGGRPLVSKMLEDLDRNLKMFERLWNERETGSQTCMARLTAVDDQLQLEELQRQRELTDQLATTQLQHDLRAKRDFRLSQKETETPCIHLTEPQAVDSRPPGTICRQPSAATGSNRAAARAGGIWEDTDLLRRCGQHQDRMAHCPRSRDNRANALCDCQRLHLCQVYQTS